MTEYTLEPVEGDPFAQGYTLEAVDGDPFAKKDTSLTKALAYGAEGVLRGADATTQNIKAALGYAKGRSLATGLADKLHQSAGLANYAPAGEVVGDSSKGVMSRIANIPRAMVEGVPSIATQAGPGGIANFVYQNIGNNLDAARASGQGAGAAIAATAADSLLQKLGIKSTLAAPATKLGLKSAAKAVGAAGVAGGTNVAQTLIDKNVIEGKPASAEDLVVSGVMGAGASSAFNALKGVRAARNIGADARAEAVSGLDPNSVSRVADLFGSRDTSNDAASRKAIDAARVSLKTNLNTFSRGASKDPELQRVKEHLKKNIPPDEEDLAAVTERYAEDRPDLIQTINDLHTANSVVDNIGNISKDSYSGGITGSKFGHDWLTPFENRGGYMDRWLFKNALLHSVPGAKTAIGAAEKAMLGVKALGYAGAYSVDRLTKSNNPLGRFVDEYGGRGVPPVEADAFNPTPEVDPVAAGMSSASSQAPQTTPQSLLLQNLGFAPGETPSPNENKIISKILQRNPDARLGPMPGEDITSAPERVLPRGADAAFRAPPPEDIPISPATEAKLAAYSAKFAKKNAEVEPSDAFKTARAEAMARKQESDRGKSRFLGRKQPADAPKPAEASKVAKSTKSASEAFSAPLTWEDFLANRSQSTEARFSGSQNSEFGTTRIGTKLRSKPTQEWTKGNVVNVGLVKDLLIVGGDANSGYTLVGKPNSKGISQSYRQVPHRGLTKESTVPFDEAISSLGKTKEPKTAPEAFSVAFSEAPAPAAKPVTHTREVGRGKHKVTVREDKIRNRTEDDKPDVEGFFRGVEGKAIAREDFMDTLKANLPQKLHSKADNLTKTLMKSGVSHAFAREKFNGFVKGLSVSDKRKAQLRAMFEASSLNTKKHWND